MPYSSFVCLLIKVYPACLLFGVAPVLEIGLWGATSHSAQSTATSRVKHVQLRLPLPRSLNLPTNLEAIVECLSWQGWPCCSAYCDCCLFSQALRSLSLPTYAPVECLFMYRFIDCPKNCFETSGRAVWILGRVFSSLEWAWHYLFLVSGLEKDLRLIPWVLIVIRLASGLGL